MKDNALKPDTQVIKIVNRLRFDPKYQDIQKKALNDPENVKKYAKEVILEFKLDIGWEILLQHVLLKKNFSPRLTGASIQPYVDPITNETRYFIPVNPETTQDNVLSSYKLIKSRYKESGSNKLIRKSDPMKTDLQLYAYRKYVDGLNSKEIQAALKAELGDDLKLFEIKELIKEGKAKRLG